MSIEPAPKVYLQNRLTRCRHNLDELRPVLHSKQQEVGKLAELVPAYAQNHALGNAEEVADVWCSLIRILLVILTRTLPQNYLEGHHQLTFYCIRAAWAIYTGKWRVVC